MIVWATGWLFESRPVTATGVLTRAILMFPLFSRLPILSPILVTSVCMALLNSSPIVTAAPPVERVTFQLNGPRCKVQHANILSALSPLPGVQAVDLSSVPGHALIDIDTETLSAQNLVEKVRKLWRDEASCLVEPMQSCISADPFGHIGRSSISHVGRMH
jgi:copper chaperone CopZ